MSSPESSPQAGTLSQAAALPFRNTYARLPERFFARANPVPVANPQLIKLNIPLAEQLGLDPAFLASPAGVQILAGNVIASASEPLAMAYAGHQFGNFVPTLGDGRANLLGEFVDRANRRFDLHLKGSGPTPFSRRGDGRAALGPVLREYILSEAMFALGVPTTRALAALTTGQPVLRETPQPGAIFARVASSHLRVGTFQYFAARGDHEALRVLADHAIERHNPECARADRPYAAFFRGVVLRQATLVAHWMLLGFIHGVMNTDNCSISGETIDYGPCAFMEAFDPGAVFSSIDAGGRYAYANQPPIALWNLVRLAEALLPLLEAEAGSSEGAQASAHEALDAFAPQYDGSLLAGLRRKLGLSTSEESDLTLAQDLLDRMAANGADFTLTFRGLCDAAEDPAADAKLRGLFSAPEAFDAWAQTWRDRLASDPLPASERAAAMRRANPTYIPRNHLVQAVIEAAVQRADFKPFEDLVAVTSRPFDDQPGREAYTLPARDEERVLYTFCGT